MRFETLSTERLLIRRLAPSDAQVLSDYRSMPEVFQFQSWTHYSQKQASDLIAEMSATDPSAKGKWFQFGVSLKETGELIGDIGFLNTDESQKSWIGFTLNSKYWGKGYATESVGAILSYYSALGIAEVWASIDPQNHASAQLLKKLNFILVESKLKDHIYRVNLTKKLTDII